LARAKKRKETGEATRERILVTGERLMAERGLDGVSLRELTSLADVNLASVHYHFGSKEEVLAEVFALRAKPLAERRLEMLAAVRREADGRPVLEDVLDAFLRPSLEIARQEGGEHFLRLRARLAYERNETSRAILAEAFDRSSAAFLAALGEALPELPKLDLYWRFHFMLGAMSYTMANPGRIQSLTKDVCDAGDMETALHYMIPFLIAGFTSQPLAGNGMAAPAAERNAGKKPATRAKRKAAGD